MQNLPIFLEMRDRTAVVVGGGVVAARRAEFLVRCGAHVTAFAPELGEDFLELRHRPNFRHVARNPGPEDFEGSTLCFIATEDQGLAEEARSAAQAAGALVNVADQPRLCDFIMPSIVDRSPLVIAISTGGASPILGRMLKARLETQIPAAYGRLAHLMSGFRQRVAEVMPSQTTRRRFWETVLEGPIGEAALTGNERAAGAHLAREIEHVREHADLVPRGEVYLVGAGPGDPDLVTFRALRLMQKADVVLYDRLIGEGVMNLVRREAERIYVGKRPDDHELPQEEIGALLVRLALEGKRVLRLKGGDPFMFGRGGEEIETLAAHGVPFQVCPGVTAAIGASAYAGIPLTHRDHAQACVFVTGHGRDGKIDLDWTTLLHMRSRLIRIILRFLLINSRSHRQRLHTGIVNQAKEAAQRNCDPLWSIVELVPEFVQRLIDQVASQQRPEIPLLFRNKRSGPGPLKIRVEKDLTCPRRPKVGIRFKCQPVDWAHRARFEQAVVSRVVK